MKSNLTLFVVLFSLFFAPLTWAKNLTHRLGVGPKTAFSFDLPALAATYYPYQDLGIVGAIGVDTQKDYSRFGILGGVRRIIFEEQQMNFYFGGNFSIVSLEVAGSSSSGFELSALAGGEFFLQGLDNLSFVFEGGAGIVSLGGNTRFKTIADIPMKAGVTFYF